MSEYEIALEQHGDDEDGGSDFDPFEDDDEQRLMKFEFPGGDSIEIWDSALAPLGRGLADDEAPRVCSVCEGTGERSKGGFAYRLAVHSLPGKSDYVKVDPNYRSPTRPQPARLSKEQQQLEKIRKLGKALLSVK